MLLVVMVLIARLEINWVRSWKGNTMQSFGVMDIVPLANFRKFRLSLYRAEIMLSYTADIR